MFGGKFPVSVSLGIIAAVIGGSILLSLVFPKAGDEVGEHRNRMVELDVSADQTAKVRPHSFRLRPVVISLLLIGLALLVLLALLAY